MGTLGIHKKAQKFVSETLVRTGRCNELVIAIAMVVSLLHLTRLPLDIEWLALLLGNMHPIRLTFRLSNMRSAG